MTSYNLHFVIALSLATIFAVVSVQSRSIRVFSFAAIPISFYLLFYNYNYNYLAGIFPVIESYIGSTFVFFVYYFFSTVKKTGHRNFVSQKIALKSILLYIFQLTLVAYVFLIPWAIDTFPLSNIEAVLFTILAGTNDGAENFVVSSLLVGVLVPAVLFFLVISLFQIAAAFTLDRRKINIEFSLWRIKYSLYSNGMKKNLLQLQIGLSILLLLYSFIPSVFLPSIIFSAPFKARFQKPVDSELYRNHFVHPDSINITPPNNPKNMIVVMLESMEINFERYTPEIVELQRNNTNFYPGGETVAGTSWTIAAVVGKFCGIPLNMPMGINEHHGKLPTYLPYATCLMDVLKKNGYNQLYIQGTSGEFTQKRKFWTVHGDVDVHDIEYYKQNKKIPDDYFVFWGFEDRKLYELAKQELERLSNETPPFALYMLTVDTHQPEGYVDNLCSKEFDSIDGNFPKAVRCASKMLDDFLNWAKQQPWYDNTVISVMGDHSMPMLSAKINVPPSDSLYWTNFIINSAVSTPIQQRQYSSLDMYPTLLESMGFKLETRSAGLGRSLYSDSLTMLELYGRAVLDSLLRERSVQYDLFLMKK